MNPPNKIKAWEELTIRDNFIFQQAMQNETLCKGFIERLLRIKVRHIKYLTAEKTIELSAFGKGVRLDVFVADSRGAVYTLEMQTYYISYEELAKRTRYYQSEIDLEILLKGMDYDELKNSFIVFICDFDPFGLGRLIYTFRNRCIEADGLELGDGATKIFLNAKGKTGDIDPDIEKFLRYVGGKPAEGEFTKTLADEVSRIKRHEETKVAYMTLTAEIMRQRRFGREEGREEGRESIIKKMLIEGASLEFISKVSGWTAEKILALRSQPVANA